MIILDRDAPRPFYLQIYSQFVAAISSGEYREGERIPSVRNLAKELNVSVNTVALAYQSLVSEGYVEARPHRGFFVNRLEDAPLAKAPEAHSAHYEKDLALLRAHDNAAQAERDAIRYDFNYGNADTSTLSISAWANLSRSVMFQPELDDAFRYGDARGLPALRECIAHNLLPRYGIHAQPEQIAIHPRARLALASLSDLFNPKHDVVAMEDPGFIEAARAFQSQGFTVEPPPIAHSGDEAIAALDAVQPSLVYLTPANQYPTNRVMDLETRRAYVRWAAEHDAFLVEDNYCHEFRYGIDSLPSLHALDSDERVIVLGTFSKALSPALCLSHMTLPPALMLRWLETRPLHPAVPWQTQATLAAFIEGGQWERHLNKLRALCRKKHDAITSALDAHMGDRVEFLDHRAGLHLLLRTYDERSATELIRTAQAAGVCVYPTDQYWLKGAPAQWDYVLLGFSSIGLEDIEPGIAALARAWGFTS